MFYIHERPESDAMFPYPFSSAILENFSVKKERK